MTKPKQHKCPHCGHDIQTAQEAKQIAADRAADREWARMARSLGIKYVRTKDVTSKVTQKKARRP